MAATPQIIVTVHASLPLTVVRGANLDLSTSNWHWVHCLSLPPETLNTLDFSRRPYKWIRYAVGVVIGAQGELSTSSDLSNVVTVDYNADLPADSVALYYHTTDEEKQRMFPIDPQILRTEVSSTVSSNQIGSFRNKVIERDGQSCVWTGWDELFCDAVHLMAYARGDEYISNFTHRRQRNDTDIIEDIDDVRNGIFLNKFAHVMLGMRLAFLMTPNFAMNTDDIDDSAPPGQRRCTAHIISNGNLPPGLTSGSLVQISDGPQSPPLILFDALVLHNFGTETMRITITTGWKDSFYSDVMIDERTPIQKALAREDRRNARHERRARRHGPDGFDMLMAIPYLLVPPNERQAVMRAAREKVEAAEQRHVQEKVEGWIRDVDV